MPLDEPWLGEILPVRDVKGAAPGKFFGGSVGLNERVRSTPLMLHGHKQTDEFSAHALF